MKLMFYIFLVFFTSLLHAAGETSLCCDFSGRSFLSPRSQSAYSYRDFIGIENHMHLYEDARYDLFSATFLLSKSFDSSHIAQYFFGTDRLVFSGSSVSDRSSEDILADYFGLPTDYLSTVCFRPDVCTVVLDMIWHISLSDVLRGLYLYAHAPIVHTRWDLDLSECIQNGGDQGYIPGYMAAQSVERSSLYESAGEFFTGSKIIGDIQPLSEGKICGKRTRTRIADIKFVVGYAFWLKKKHDLGLNARLLIPTGNRSRAEYLFEPIVGNGHHWGLGVGLTGHRTIWCNDDGSQCMDLYTDLNVIHLFNARQRRSFDLKKNGRLSRYMLIQQMGNPVVGRLNFDPVPINNQYLGRLMPAINKTTFDVDIHIAAQIEFVINYLYRHNNSNDAIGYTLGWSST